MGLRYVHRNVVNNTKVHVRSFFSPWQARCAAGERGDAPVFAWAFVLNGFVAPVAGNGADLCDRRGAKQKSLAMSQAFKQFGCGGRI